MSMTIWKIKLTLLIAISLLLSYNEVVGGRSHTKDNVFSKPIKSIQTVYGDIYDCVNFYKQPAFDHPLLQNHTYTFQVRPSSFPKGFDNTYNGAPKKVIKRTLEIWSNAEGCPVGTVPIKRMSKADLIRIGNASRFTPTISGQVHAVVRTTNPNRKYNGVGANIGIFNPHLFHTNQYSSGRMKIQNGGDSITVGWTVNPTLYGDNRTRLFTYLNAGQSHCFNTQCPGFIMVNKEVPLDYVFYNISSHDVQFSIRLIVHRDTVTGDWWLNIGDDNIQIGFWPKRIFTGLGDLASYIDWGGEVYSPPNEPAPYMGSGHLPYGDTTYDGYCRHLTFVNEAHQIVDATDTEHYVDNIYYYGVLDWWDKLSDWHHVMAFGGGLWHNEN